jgi:magnesium transporter
MEVETHHRPETAGRHLIRRVPTGRAQETLAEVLARLPGHVYDSADTVYVVDAAGRLEGLVPLHTLLAEPPDRSLGEVMQSGLPSVHPDADQEKVALLALRYGLSAVAVIDKDSRLLGVVPGGTLLRVLWREHSEDVHRLAGVLREGEQAQAAVEGPPRRRLIRRLPWLLAGLGGSVIATAVMARFEHVLEERIAIAFFIPAIVYLADAVGTQTEAMVVRYLAVGHAPLGRLLRGELLTGMLIGLCLIALVFPTTLVSFGDIRLAAAVAAAVGMAGLVACAIGLVLPWFLSRIGRDPAFGSGPVATIIQDVVSLLIYFAAVAVFLG